MYNFRYYAIGHSYLKHGPFNGWQTDGFWGMAASAPEKITYIDCMQNLPKADKTYICVFGKRLTGSELQVYTEGFDGKELTIN